MKCPNCGKEIAEGQHRCHHCGAFLWKPKADKPKKEAKEK